MTGRCVEMQLLFRISWLIFLLSCCSYCSPEDDSSRDTEPPPEQIIGGYFDYECDPSNWKLGKMTVIFGLNLSLYQSLCPADTRGLPEFQRTTDNVTFSRACRLQDVGACHFGYGKMGCGCAWSNVGGFYIMVYTFEVFERFSELENALVHNRHYLRGFVRCTDASGNQLLDFSPSCYKRCEQQELNVTCQTFANHVLSTCTCSIKPEPKSSIPFRRVLKVREVSLEFCPDATSAEKKCFQRCHFDDYMQGYISSEVGNINGCRLMNSGYDEEDSYTLEVTVVGHPGLHSDSFFRCRPVCEDKDVDMAPAVLQVQFSPCQYHTIKVTCQLFKENVSSTCTCAIQPEVVTESYERHNEIENVTLEFCRKFSPNDSEPICFERCIYRNGLIDSEDVDIEDCRLMEDDEVNDVHVLELAVLGQFALHTNSVFKCSSTCFRGDSAEADIPVQFYPVCTLDPNGACLHVQKNTDIEEGMSASTKAAVVAAPIVAVIGSVCTYLGFAKTALGGAGTCLAETVLFRVVRKRKEKEGAEEGAEAPVDVVVEEPPPPAEEEEGGGTGEQVTSSTPSEPSTEGASSMSTPTSSFASSMTSS